MQEFKISRHFTLCFIGIGLSMFVSALLFFNKFESAKIDIFHYLFLGLPLITIAIGIYGKWFIRLYISDIGIRLEDSYFGWLSYEFSWQEVEQVMTIANPMNKQVQFFFHVPQRNLLKSLNPLLFDPVDGKQYSKPLSFKERLFGSKQTTALERAIRQYSGETKAVKQTDVRALMKQSSMDLGKEAGFLAGASLVMFTVGIVLLIWGNSKHLLLSPSYYWIGIVAIFALFLAIKILPSDKKMTIYTITPLFAGCGAWLFVQCMHFYVLHTTEPEIKQYRLSETQNVYQLWQAPGLPDIEVHADPGNLIHEKEGTIQAFKLHIGPMGFYDVTRNEVNKLFKKNQRLGVGSL